MLCYVSGKKRKKEILRVVLDYALSSTHGIYGFTIDSVWRQYS